MESAEEGVERRRSSRELAENRLQVEFVARRAYRSPRRRCTRRDVMEAFGISPARASQILAEALAQCDDLVRKDRHIEPPPWGVTPHWAGEEDLMEALDDGRRSFADLGLREDELPINPVPWRKRLPAKPGALEAVVRALTAGLSVYVHYTSLNQGDAGKWRRILPICLESVDGQWRICSQDLDKDGAPLRSFALTRITDFRRDDEKVPRSVVRENARDVMARVRVSMDRRMTESQLEAIAVEFSVRERSGHSGIVQVPRRSLHEFRSQFVQTREVSQEISQGRAGPGQILQDGPGKNKSKSSPVWPPFEFMETL